jgi:serine/threonine-protein kinase
MVEVDAPRIGQLVKGRYELLELLGEGGQGHVYRARDKQDGDEVAVKVLRDRPSDHAATERMFREAQALVTLWGTGAVRPMDQGWTADGHFAIVMELLQGRDLETVCRGFERAGERAPLDFVLSVFEPVVSTIERAHEHGIVHRDLKPGNVFVLDGGGVRLLDFGFAKFLRKARITAMGVIAGSPSYVAPEMWMGREADTGVDVYALGALIFRTLGGRPPFSGTMGRLLEVVVSAPRPSLRALRPELPPAIDDWVPSALAIKPQERFQTVRALWTAFVNAVGAPAR